MYQFLPLAEAADSSGGMGSWITIILLYAVVIGGLYLIVIRPQSKKKKKEESMRKNVQIGDEITTIGGISGRVVGIKEDSELIIDCLLYTSCSASATLKCCSAAL